jgi:hypothetical protein
VSPPAEPVAAARALVEQELAAPELSAQVSPPA